LRDANPNRRRHHNLELRFGNRIKTTFQSGFNGRNSQSLVAPFRPAIKRQEHHTEVRSRTAEE
jgi:hypothetical protein